MMRKSKKVGKKFALEIQYNLNILKNKFLLNSLCNLMINLKLNSCLFLSITFNILLIKSINAESNAELFTTIAVNGDDTKSYNTHSSNKKIDPNFLNSNEAFNKYYKNDERFINQITNRIYDPFLDIQDKQNYKVSQNDDNLDENTENVFENEETKNSSDVDDDIDTLESNESINKQKFNDHILNSEEKKQIKRRQTPNKQGHKQKQTNLPGQHSKVGEPTIVHNQLPYINSPGISQSSDTTPYESNHYTPFPGGSPNSKQVFCCSCCIFLFVFSSNVVEF